MTLSDTDWLALTLWGEARSESIAGQCAVASVIRNRLRDGRWGRSYETVVLAPKQFSCWMPEGGKANYDALQLLKQQIVLNGIPNDRFLKTAYWIASGCVDGVMPNEIQNATHYYVTNSPTPKWAVNVVPVKVIGAHSFFVVH